MDSLSEIVTPSILGDVTRSVRGRLVARERSIAAGMMTHRKYRQHTCTAHFPELAYCRVSRGTPFVKSKKHQ